MADVHSAFELAKEGHDLDLTYKVFENALKQLAHKLYRVFILNRPPSFLLNNGLKGSIKDEDPIQKGTETKVSNSEISRETQDAVEMGGETRESGAGQNGKIWRQSDETA